MQNYQLIHATAQAWMSYANICRTPPRDLQRYAADTTYLGASVARRDHIAQYQALQARMPSLFPKHFCDEWKAMVGPFVSRQLMEGNEGISHPSLECSDTMDRCCAHDDSMSCWA